MEPTKQEIKALQGLSVFAMLCLHLFCRYHYADLYTPLVSIVGYPLCFYLGQASDFCVTGFALCSGYALSTQLSCAVTPPGYYSKRITSLLQLICRFHVILFVFTLISLFMGNGASIPGSLTEFIGNFFLYGLSYNGAWWYLITYVFIVFSSYPIIRWIHSCRSCFTIPVFAALYFVCYVLRFDFPSENWLIRQGYLYGMTLAQFAIGVYFHKHRVFSRAAALYARLPLKRCLLFLAVLAAILIRTHILPTLFVAPVSGILFMLAFHVNCRREQLVFRFFEYLGIHSTNIWLTHMFFYQYIFVNFIFIFCWPPLILAAMLVVTLLTSQLLMRLQIPLCKRIAAYKKPTNP